MGSDATQLNATRGAPQLQRALSLWDLILYGFVITSPTPAPQLGNAQIISHGHTVSTLLIAMIPMALTAVSFGRLSTIYPSAGSAYTYTARGLNPHLGFVVGWAMFVEYMILVIASGIYIALIVNRLLPEIPYVLGAALAVGGITLVNLRGIRWTAATNKVLMIFMTSVLGIFILLAVRYIFHRQGWHGLVSVQPFYDPHTFDLHALAMGTAFMSVSYIGFEGVTTLAEEVKNPRRNVWLATVLVCVLVGLFSMLQMYLAQQVWPQYQSYQNVDTVFVDIARRVGGVFLFNAMAVCFFVNFLGTGLTGQVSSARLLFSMGRDGILPPKIFARLDPRRANPAYNILIIGTLAFVGTQALNWEGALEVFSSVALFTYAAVNLAALRQFYGLKQVDRKPRLGLDAIAPGLAFVFCAVDWWYLPWKANAFGMVALAAGLLYDGIQTRGFRTQPAMIDFSQP
jgi:amino acid transporter